MARRPPTADQKAKAEARRQAFRELASQANRMTEDAKVDLVNRLGAVCTIEGRPLSFGNTVLCLMQAPTTTIVGGFRQWLDAGRCVRKGEHGMMIWVPVTKKSKKDEPAADTEPGSRPGFIPGTVFDVSQTEPTADRQQADQPASEPEPAGGLLFA